MSRQWIACVLISALAAAPVLAQMPERPPSPVRFTEVRQQAMRGQVTLPGTVQARTSSVVASEVAGLVVELRAREGDTVRRGQSIARLRQQVLELRLAESRAELKESAARLELASRSLERSRELFDSGVISQQQLDDAVSESDAWQGRVDQSDAAIARLEDDLERSRVPAPFSGVVVEEFVDVGEWLDVGGPVVAMVSLDDLEIVTDVPEHMFSSIKKGAAVTVTLGALPGLSVEGEVGAVIPRADPQARTFPVKVRIGNPEGRIGVGMLARVTFEAGAERQALIVPKDAVTRQGPQQIVYVLGDDDTVRPVTVVTGGGMGLWIAVEGALSPGQRVVVRGNERLRPGQKVMGEPQEYDLP